MGRGHDPRGAVHIEPHVVAGHHARLARVEPDPDPHRHAVRPALRAHRPLDRDGRDDCALCLGEDGEDRIALRADLDPTRRLEFRPDNGAMALQDLGVPVAEPLQQTGGAFDVAEEERQGAVGKVAHRRQVSGRCEFEASRHGPGDGCEARIDGRDWRRVRRGVAAAGAWRPRRSRLTRFLSLAGVEPTVRPAES